MADIATGTPFSLAPDGHDGFDLTTNYTAEVYTVSTEAELAAAIDSLDGFAAGSDISATIAFAPGADIDLTQALPTLSLPADMRLEIAGDGGTLDGLGAQQGLVIAGAATVTVDNLDIVDTLARGDDDYANYGGGGGAGLGGGLFHRRRDAGHAQRRRLLQ